MTCLCPNDEPHSCNSLKYAWFESRKERDSKPDRESSDLIIKSTVTIPKKFAKIYRLQMSSWEIEKITDQMADYFLEMIRKDSTKIDFNVLEKRLKIKYSFDGHSSMILAGRKGIHIIVDHEMPNPWSEINCKTEIKLFQKCGLSISEYKIRQRVYSYVIDPQEDFYKKLRKMPDSFWDDKSKSTTSISQDILGQIEKTAISLGFTLDDILKLMGENEYITKIRYESK